jgi:hypothetical protein
MAFPWVAHIPGLPSPRHPEDWLHDLSEGGGGGGGGQGLLDLVQFASSIWSSS